jgi:Tol biopolymer transport system component
MRPPASPPDRRPRAARFARSLGVAALGALALSTGEGPLLAVRLNHALLPGEDVNAWAVSPDGKRFFYTVTQPVFDAGQIFSAPSDGRHGEFPLTDPLPSGRQILGQIQVSPDGQHLVYLADQDTNDQYEIYSVPTDGSQPPVKLNAPLSPSGDVFHFFLITPDAEPVVFTAGGDLYSARTDGSQPAVQLDASTAAGVFRVTSDSARVVFLKSGQLYSVPVDGSAAPLHLSVAGTFLFWEIQLSPDGRVLVYRSYSFVMSNYVYRIWSVPVDGSTAPVLLFGPVTESDTDEQPIIRISPDSERVAHRSTSVPTPRVLESAPLDGSAPAVTLNDPGGNVSYDYRWTQDGRVVFGYSPSGVNTGIYVVPGDRSQSPQRITGMTTFPVPMKWEVTPQGRVVFVGYDGTYDLYSVPLDGSAAPLLLNPPMVPGGNIISGNVLNTPSFRLTPRGDSLVYVADQETDEVFEGYHVRCNGSALARKINRTPAPGGDISQFVMVITPDSRRVIYGADQEEDQFYEFFTSTLNGLPTVGNSTPLGPDLPVLR